MANDLDKITQNFINEIGDIQLNEEQRRIYNAFVYRRRKPYKFSVTDKYDNTIRFTLYTDKKIEGVIHILEKHYDGDIGHVTAWEIINLCDVIRTGDFVSDGKSLTYTKETNGKKYSLIVGLKETGSGNVLKSFYSDKSKSSGTAGKPQNTGGANSKTLTIAKVTKN
ncbi:MAG: hypothetical protein J6T48_05135 [Bacteroidales bacterium]|nr:hypothetical protein [Bacteroidales bacterium]